MPSGIRSYLADMNKTVMPGSQLATLYQYRCTEERPMIRKAGKLWQVVSKDGKVLGTHDTKKEAEAQLAAVEASKHSRARKRK